MRYSLEESGQLQWLGEDDRSADDLSARPTSSAKLVKRQEIREYLVMRLAAVEVLVSELREEADKRGYAWKALEEARKSLGGYSRQLHKDEKEAQGLDPKVPVRLGPTYSPRTREYQLGAYPTRPT